MSSVFNNWVSKLITATYHSESLNIILSALSTLFGRYVLYKTSIYYYYYLLLLGGGTRPMDVYVISCLHNEINTQHPAQSNDIAEKKGAHILIQHFTQETIHDCR